MQNLDNVFFPAKLDTIVNYLYKLYNLYYTIFTFYLMVYFYNEIYI